MNPVETAKLYKECVDDLPKVAPAASEEQHHLGKLLALDRKGYERGSDGAIAESLRSLLFRRGLGRLASGNIDAGWKDLCEALDYFEFALRGEILAVYLPENYERTTIVPRVFIEMISVALAAKDHARAKWAAEHLDKLFEARVVAENIRDDEIRGLFDAVTIGLASGNWPEDAASSTGDTVYTSLFGDIKNSAALPKALYSCCNFHMERIARGMKLREEPPENVFISVPWAAMPLEMLYWRGLYELHFGSLDVKVDHVLWQSPLLQTRPSGVPPRKDMFEKINAMAREAWGADWDKAGIQ